MRVARSLFFLISLVAVVVCAPRAAADEPPRRHQLDDRDLETMAATSPEAAQAFTDGEAQLQAANLKAAESAFARARELFPQSGLAARRHAQVLTELGRKTEAVAACKQAILMSRMGIDARACVATLMIGSAPPSVDDVYEALKLAAWAKRMPGQPFGDAALCEIAYRLGDEGMLKHCVDSLRSYAPDHYETRRFAATLHEEPQWPLWLGWGAVMTAGLGTLLHWARRRAVRSSQVALPVALSLLAASVALPARAQEAAPTTSVEKVAPQDVPKDPAEQKRLRWQLSSEFPINPDAPEASVPSIEKRNKSPLEFGYFLQDLAAEGAAAEKKGEFAVAARYWAAMVKAVPDVAVGYRRACKAFEQAKDLAKAIEYCAGALNQRDVQLDDFGQASRLVLSKPQLAPTDVTDVDAMVKHLQTSQEGQPELGLAGAHIACELGLRLEDKKRMETCTAALAKGAPQDPKTLSFRWSYAMLRHDYAEARSLIPQLKKAGMPDTALAKLEHATAEAGVWWRRPAVYFVGLLVVAAVVGGWLMQRRKRAATGAPSAGPTVSPA